MNFGILVYHEVNELAAFGLYSVLSLAKKITDEELELFTIAKSRKSVHTDGGLIITPQYAFVSSHSPDILIIPGGAGVYKAAKDRVITTYLEQLEAKLRNLLIVSSAVVIAGELGFLQDKKVAAPKGFEELLDSYEVTSSSSSRIVKDGKIWSGSSAITSIDLGLELVTEFYGGNIARQVANKLGIAAQQGLF